MKREIREQLKFVYEAPPSLHKKEFVQRWNHQPMNIWEVLCSQATYIRKWIWVVSTLIFVTAVFGVVPASNNLMWIFSALTPLLAVTVIAESGRSDNYEMTELEMATRFSLKSVVFARLGILGIENLFVLGFLIVVGIWNGEEEPFQTGVCILIPYLLTTFIGLCIVRRFKGHEAMYYCMGIAVAIGCFVFLSGDMVTRIYQGYDPIWWGSIMLLLTGGVIRQYRNMIIETEELACSLR